MPKNKIIIALGALIAILPLLGFPPGWEAFFQVIAGLVIVSLSVLITIDKKLMQRAKARKRQERRVTGNSESEAEAEAVRLGRRVTDVYPKTGMPGRRATDIKWNAPPPTISEETEDQI